MSLNEDEGGLLRAINPERRVGPRDRRTEENTLKDVGEQDSNQELSPILIDEDEYARGLLLKDEDCGYNECEDNNEYVLTTPSVCGEENLSVESTSSATYEGYDSVIRKQTNTERCVEVKAGVTHTTPSVCNEVKSDKLGQSWECEYVRGICKLHRVRGKKVGETSSKKWRKLKYGFGWVTSKVNVYTCPVGAKLPHLSPVQHTNDELSLSPDLCSQKGGNANFSHFSGEIRVKGFEQRSESGESEEIS